MLRHMVLACSAVVLLISQSGRAGTFYVSPAGNDGGPGVRAMPWRTLQKAGNTARPGDTIIVEPGKYAGFVLGWDKPLAGKSDKPIVFEGRPGAIIDTRNARTKDGIDLEPGCEWIIINGFTVQNVDRAGIRVCGSDHVQVNGNDCENNGVWGIFTSHSNDTLIENNITAHSKEQHGIYVSNSAEHAVIRNNKIFANANCGIHLNGDESQGGSGLITNSLIENNTIYDNGSNGGSAINGDGLTSSVIRCNLLYNNHSSGISLFDEDAAHGASDNFIVNNTIVMAANARWAININRKSTGNVLANNILVSASPRNGSICITDDSEAAFVSDYNLLVPRFCVEDNVMDSLAEWQKSSGQDAHSRAASADQLFVDPAKGDFHLKTGSPAIGAGSAAIAKNHLPSTDPSGENFASIPDIGAFHFAASKP